MLEKKTLEDFLMEALEKKEIEFKVLVSENGGKIRFYLISNKKEEGKNRVIGVEVKKNSVKLL